MVTTTNNTRFIKAKEKKNSEMINVLRPLGNHPAEKVGSSLMCYWATALEMTGGNSATCGMNKSNRPQEQSSFQSEV